MKELLLCLFLLISGCAPISFNQALDADQLVQSNWSRNAYLKAEARLSVLKEGIDFDAFTHVINLQAVLKGDKVVDVTAEGLLVRENKEYKNGKSVDWVFGYVERGLAVEKYVVEIKNEKVIHITDLKAADLGPVDMRSTSVKSFDYFTSKEGYAEAKKNLQTIATGMGMREVLKKMKGFYIPTGREFYFYAPGYLRDLYKVERTDGDCVEYFHFGYLDGKKVTEGFIMKFVNGVLTEIVK
jgi:hypothetical protein